MHCLNRSSESQLHYYKTVVSKLPRLFLALQTNIIENIRQNFKKCPDNNNTFRKHLDSYAYVIAHIKNSLIFYIISMLFNKYIVDVR